MLYELLDLTQKNLADAPGAIRASHLRRKVCTFEVPAHKILRFTSRAIYYARFWVVLFQLGMGVVINISGASLEVCELSTSAGRSDGYGVIDIAVLQRVSRISSE